MEYLLSLTDKNLYYYCDNNPLVRIETANQLIFNKAAGCLVDVGAVVTAGLAGAIEGC